MAVSASTTAAGVVTETYYVQSGNNVTSYVSSVYVAPVNYTLYVALGVLALCLGTGAFGLRMYVRRIMVKTFGYDDWVLVVAYVSTRSIVKLLGTNQMQVIYVGYVGLYIAIPARILHEGLQDAYFEAVGVRL